MTSIIFPSVTKFLSGFISTPFARLVCKLSIESLGLLSPYIPTVFFFSQEVTRLNVEAAFVCLQSIVEELTRQAAQQMTDQLLMDDIPGSETGQNSSANTLEQDLRPALSKFQGCLEIVWARLSLFLTFLAIMVGTFWCSIFHLNLISCIILDAGM